MLKFSTNNIRENILSEFNVLFGCTPGLYNNRAIKLHIKENARPFALGARHVPYALKVVVENEIDRLLKIGHLKKLEMNE